MQQDYFNTMIQMLLLTLQPQKPILFARSPLPLLEGVQATLKLPFCATNLQIHLVCTEYCKVKHVQTLPEECFMRANVQPNKSTEYSKGSDNWTGWSRETCAVFAGIRSHLPTNYCILMRRICRRGREKHFSAEFSNA